MTEVRWDFAGTPSQPHASRLAAGNALFGEAESLPPDLRVCSSVVMSRVHGNPQ